jgi:hypothetical protein
MAVGVAVFTSTLDRQPGPWPAYVFAPEDLREAIRVVADKLVPFLQTDIAT